jgi:PiT family inorganic phosphate transporter
MDVLFDGSLTTLSVVFIVLALALAFGFEFVNGFHDTANAVATVIYTHTLKPTTAVVWSGFWNFLGVLTSTGAVAFGILALLPVELIVNVGSAAGFAMVFALLVSAIIWNLGTWYLGLPASSSHTLIGAIVGVGLANSLLAGGRPFGDGVNWGKVQDVGLSLGISPLIGFFAAALLLLLAKALIRNPELYTAPEGDKPPPLWIRGLLVLTCTGVSFAHGSNDGQKGMGLIMLILIGIVPAVYALNPGTGTDQLAAIAASSDKAAVILEHTGKTVVPVADPAATLSATLRTGLVADESYAALAIKNKAIRGTIDGVKSFTDVPPEVRSTLRTDIYLVTESLGKVLKAPNPFSAEDKATLTTYKDQLKATTQFIPTWVKVAVALALGLGTMVGWKRIVVTVGEKIGKAHLTYGQGASAELVAMATIGAADVLGLPVSTTHVLSSGVAGTMAANGSGLQMNTLRNLLLAWVLTLPACVLLGATFFSAGLYLVLHIFGL